jgi:hypothetical protein
MWRVHAGLDIDRRIGVTRRKLRVRCDDLTLQLRDGSPFCDDSRV